MATANTTEPELRMLLVDDHAIVREGLKRVLNPTGNNWGLTEAETGFEALAFLRESEFDLALVDLSMPGMTEPPRILRRLLRLRMESS